MFWFKVERTSAFPNLVVSGVVVLNLARDPVEVIVKAGQRRPYRRSPLARSITTLSTVVSEEARRRGGGGVKQSFCVHFGEPVVADVDARTAYANRKSQTHTQT